MHLDSVLVHLDFLDRIIAIEGVGDGERAAAEDDVVGVLRLQEGVGIDLGGGDRHWVNNFLLGANLGQLCEESGHLVAVIRSHMVCGFVFSLLIINLNS